MRPGGSSFINALTVRAESAYFKRPSCVQRDLDELNVVSAIDVEVGIGFALEIVDSEGGFTKCCRQLLIADSDRVVGMMRDAAGQPVVSLALETTILVTLPAGLNRRSPSSSVFSNSNVPPGSDAIWRKRLTTLTVTTWLVWVIVTDHLEGSVGEMS
jgi:hypothetical protein